MTAEIERKVIRFLDLFHADPPDPSAIVACVSHDAIYLSRVTHAEPLRGRDAIEAELRSQFMRYRDCECEIVGIASTAHKVFVERRDTVTMRSDGRELIVLVCAVFNFDHLGYISIWKEYWDMADIREQMER